jgi:hypothetical protein
LEWKFHTKNQWIFMISCEPGIWAVLDENEINHTKNRSAKLIFESVGSSGRYAIWMVCASVLLATAKWSTHVHKNYDMRFAFSVLMKLTFLRFVKWMRFKLRGSEDIYLGPQRVVEF